jgi:hypothetical protein
VYIYRSSVVTAPICRNLVDWLRVSLNGEQPTVSNTVHHAVDGVNILSSWLVDMNDSHIECYFSRMGVVKDYCPLSISESL